MNQQLTREQAKKTLQTLVDACVKIGGIFDSAQAVALMVYSIEVLGADDTPGTAAMRTVPSAAEQLQNRIDNSDT